MFRKGYLFILFTLGIGSLLLLPAIAYAQGQNKNQPDNMISAVVTKAIGTNVRIRELASSSSYVKILGKVNTGDIVHVYGFDLASETIGGKKGYWARVYIPSQKITGWVFSPYIDIDNGLQKNLQKAADLILKLVPDEVDRDYNFWGVSGDGKYLYRDEGTSVCYRSFWVYEVSSGKKLLSADFMRYEMDSKDSVVIMTPHIKGISSEAMSAVKKLRNSEKYKEAQRKKKELGPHEGDEFDVKIKYRYTPKTGKKTFLSCEPF